MKRIVCFCLTTMIFSPLAAVAASQCNIHTWHTIHAKNGEWKINLKAISQTGFFVDESCKPLETGLARLNDPLTYGFGFGDESTFDIAYTVTAVKQIDHAFQSPACVFVVSAKGPAQPDVTALSYNGARCEWKSVTGAGGDMFLDEHAS